MIKFNNYIKNEPYLTFRELYLKAVDSRDPCMDVVGISSYDADQDQVDSRYVNLKYIDCDNWIFFSNYESTKAAQFSSNNNISALMYWSSINVQVRIKAKIHKTSKTISDTHFLNRSNKKNALAISSSQSRKINCYDDNLTNFNDVLNTADLSKRPDNWGGYYFVPNYFEFWEGHESRVNKRQVFELNQKTWNYFILQP
tara:strand:- start:852 stop:1448 length:597 start_codon:yes stop_codon:yes gene_type:complete